MANYLETFAAAKQANPGLSDTEIEEGLAKNGVTKPGPVGRAYQAANQFLSGVRGEVRPLTEAAAGVLHGPTAQGPEMAQARSLLGEALNPVPSDLPTAVAMGVTMGRAPAGLAGAAFRAAAPPVAAGLTELAGTEGDIGAAATKVAKIAPFTVGGEAISAGLAGARNVAQTAIPAQAHKQGQKFTKEFLGGLSRDLDLPATALERSLIRPGESAGTAVAAAAGGRLKEHIGGLINTAEEKMRVALGGGGTRLNIPSLNRSVPSNTAAGGVQVKWPTFDEAVAQIKQLKMESRLIKQKGASKDEMMMAMESIRKAQAVEQEFETAVTNQIGSAGAVKDLKRAQVQFRKGMAAKDMLEEGKIFTQGPKGITLDQASLAAQLGKSRDEFTLDMFPHTLEAAGRGIPYAQDVILNAPFFSFKGAGPVGRESVGGVPLYTQRAGIKSPKRGARLLNMGAILAGQGFNEVQP